jgi:hypothetical protein
VHWYCVRVGDLESKQHHLNAKHSAAAGSTAQQLAQLAHGNKAVAHRTVDEPPSRTIISGYQAVATLYTASLVQALLH